MNFPIGEFSLMGRVSVKALRLYHERGLLVPDFVDPESGYRYYAAEQLKDLQVIQALQRFGFSLSEIEETLAECEDDAELIGRLQAKKREMERRVGSLRKSIEEIEGILTQERFSGGLSEGPFEVEERSVPETLVAGLRMNGRYETVGEGFKTLGKVAGRFADGSPMCLYHDGEYKEEDADFEPCIPIRKRIEADGIDCRLLPGMRCLSLMHVGPYEGLGGSYARLFETLRGEGLSLAGPIREVFHKGPGWILKGNPKRYRTEILFPVETL